MKRTAYLFSIGFYAFLLLCLNISLCRAQVPRQLITTIPALPQDDGQPLTIIYDASQGSTQLNDLNIGTVYAHTGLITSQSSSLSDWKYVKEDAACLMTKLGDYKWKLEMPRGIRSFYGVTDAGESISQIAIVFHGGNNHWGKGEGDSNIIINIGALCSAVPAKPRPGEPLVVTFNALHSTPPDGKGSLKGYTGDVYAHTGLITSQSTSDNDWKNATNWGDNSEKYKLTSLGNSRWQLVMEGGYEDFYPALAEDEVVRKLAFVFRSADGNSQSENIFLEVSPQLVEPSAEFPTEADAPFSLVFNMAAGDEGLKDSIGPLYVHTGVSIDGQDWQYATNWGDNDEKYKLTSLGNNRWQLDMPQGIRAFYNQVPQDKTIERLCFVVRNEKCTAQCKNADGSDIFLSIYPEGLSVRFDYPQSDVTLKTGETLRYKISSSAAARLTLQQDGTTRNEANGVQTLCSALTFDAAGTYTLTATADDGATATLTVNVQPATEAATLPADMRPGINYHADDPTKVTLVLQAPYKQEAYVLGDFNDWTYSTAWQMKRDGEYFWLTLTGLTPGQEYAYQYVVDGDTRIADPYTEKVLDPWNDQYITAETYPDLKSYPEKASGIVSVFQTGQEPYEWQVTDFKRPDTQDLIIYELHLRDFTDKGTYRAALEKVPYLKELGINAIELMPVNEFEGNDSWGYNPSFYFAVDKAYGTSDDLKRFVDECHSQGIAVIIDMVLNHSFGQSPLLELYEDEKGNPLMTNPWYNVKSNIENPGLQWGADFNHESFYTRAFVDRVNAYWLTEFRIDGIRYDFTKGFSNTHHPMNGDEWASSYDAGRIYNLTRMKEEIDKVSPGAYAICEHLTDEAEEKALGDSGLMMWRNMNPQYMQVAMGWQENSDLNKLYDWGISGMPTNSLVGYMESHDEERLAYNAKEYGIDAVKANLTNRTRQLAVCTAFFLTVPGPKMIWQFGELGYDISINENGRTGRKPRHWEYYDDADRKYLFDVYSKLLYLRNQHPELFRARGDFSNGYGFKWNVDKGSWSGGRLIRSKALDKEMVIIGNFCGAEASCYGEFGNTGWWYDYMSGDSIQVTSTTQNVTLPAHEFRLYLNFKPEEHIIHSSDVEGMDLSHETSFKLRSGGWTEDNINALNDALTNSGEIDNTTLTHADLTEAGIEAGTDLTGLFDGCMALTGIDVPHLDYTGHPLQGANPNCLVYAPAGSVPTRTGETAVNLVAGDVAVSNIRIDDSYDFHIARPFTVTGHNVSYTRTFTGAGKDGGWETISLPFSPTSISADGFADMLPVTDTQEGDFWLKAYSGSQTTGVVDFANVSSLEAHRPYIIAFPGKAWGQQYPDSWTVTFSSTDAEFDNAKAENESQDNYAFAASYQQIQNTAAVHYLLNTEKNVFEKSADAVLKPFRCYFADFGGGTGIQSLSIGSGNGNITGIEETTTNPDKGLKIVGLKGAISLILNEQIEISIYTLNGQLAYRQLLPAGTQRITLPQGCYVVNRQKVMVY